MAIKALRTSSIYGLETQLAVFNTDITNAEGDIAVINGDATVEGSIANALASANDYTDGKVGEVDLSQVQANADAIDILEGDATVEGSVDKAVADTVTAFQVIADDTKAAVKTEALDPAAVRLDVLEGPATVDGSLNKAIADLMGGVAPADLDTIKELGERLVKDEDGLVSLVALVADNKTTADQACVDANNVLAGDKAEVLDVIQAKEDTIAGVIEDASVAVLQDVATQYFAISNLFSEVVESEESQLAIRKAIGAVDASTVTQMAIDARPIFFRENVLVSNGVIQLDSRIAPEHIFHIRIIYTNNSFDELMIVPSTVAGEFTVNTGTAGDLDGTNVEVEYVIDQTL